MYLLCLENTTFRDYLSDLCVISRKYGMSVYKLHFLCRYPVFAYVCLIFLDKVLVALKAIRNGVCLNKLLIFKINGLCPVNVTYVWG